MFIECNNMQALMDTLNEWTPGREYLPPDPEYNNTTEGIYLCICDGVVNKAFKRKQDAEGYISYHNKYGLGNKIKLQEIELE